MPPQNTAAPIPLVPPTAKPAFALGAFGGPKDKPSKSAVVPDAMRFHELPSKCRMLPESPTAQPLLELIMTTAFKLLVVNKVGLACAAVDVGNRVKGVSASNVKRNGTERNSVQGPSVCG